MTAEYPAFICGDCGQSHGRRGCNPYATWHEGECDICGKLAPLTQARVFGGLKENWKEARDAR
jgi:hypothetical protein